MRIDERAVGETTVLDLHGTLAGPEASAMLEGIVRRLARTGRQKLVANLLGVSAIDAAGLGALVGAYNVVRRNQGTLKLAHVTKRIHDLIVITRLVTVFDTFDSVEDAIRDGREAAHNAPATSPAVSQPVQASLGSIERFLRRA